MMAFHIAQERVLYLSGVDRKNRFSNTRENVIRKDKMEV